MPTAYVTAPPDDANRLARLLVEERLAACVNVLPCTSVYRWEGEVLDEAEAVLLAKTTAERYPALEARVVEAHPHDVPCVERVDVADAHGPFAEWCATAVDGGAVDGGTDAGESVDGGTDAGESVDGDAVGGGTDGGGSVDGGTDREV